CFAQPSGAETIRLRPGTAKEVDGEPRVALEPRGRLPGQAELARRGVGGRVPQAPVRIDGRPQAAEPERERPSPLPGSDADRKDHDAFGVHPGIDLQT